MYGMLRPLDALRPYRLEMGTKLATDAGRDLYAYWGARVATAVLADVAQLPAAERCLINVASAEYFQVLKPHLADAAVPVYTMVFHGATVYVKGARGAIVRYAAETGATHPEQLRGFTGLQGEWRFVASASSEREYVFERGAPTKKAAAAAPKKAAARGKRAADDAAAEDAGGDAAEAAPAKPRARARRS